MDKAIIRDRYADIPGYTIDSLWEYVETRRPTGGFLRAALSNDFVEAVLRADDSNRMAILSIARLIANEVPFDARGSSERVTAWLKRKEPQDG